MEGNVCPICLELLSNFDNNNNLPVCHHVFHEICIRKWWNKVHRVECPYCRWCENYDRELITGIEGLLVKLIMYGDVHDFQLLSLQIAIKKNINDRFIYRRAINLIMSGDDKCQDIINHCLSSLVSRGYMKMQNNLYYYVS